MKTASHRSSRAFSMANYRRAPISPVNKLLMAALAFSLGEKTNGDLLLLGRVTEKARDASGSETFNRVRAVCARLVREGVNPALCAELADALNPNSSAEPEDIESDEAETKPWWQTGSME